jgi:sugar lactone lactonase YvrE
MMQAMRPQPSLRAASGHAPDLGVPDSAAFDTKDCYRIAIHGRGRPRRNKPDDRLDHEVEIPVPFPTMCAFAGTDLDTLYVTAASHGRSDEPHAGGPY